MPAQRGTALEARIARLETENSALQQELRTHGIESPTPRERDGRARRRSWGWSLLATLLIVIGAVLAPVATVASWARIQLTDTDAFVAAYEPLARDGAVKALVANEAMTVIEQNVDIPGLTSQVIDGITELGTGPGATAALETLKGPAAQGIVSLVRSTVASFVESDAFTGVWQEALRISHTQLISALQNDPNSAIAVAADGSVGIEIGPIIERVKLVLVDRGLTFAGQIPQINRTITVAQNSALPTLQLYYGVAVLFGAWLPWIALLFLGAGVAVARRRATALVWAATALGLGMVIVIGGIAIGRLFFVGSVSPSLIPAAVAVTVFDSVTTATVATAVAVLVLAIVWAVVAWLTGPFAVPRRLRTLFGLGVSALRETADHHGISTGRVGAWCYAQRTLLRTGIAVISAAVVLLVRPVSVSLVVWTLVIAALAIAAVELVQRPPAADHETPAVPGELPGDDATMVTRETVGAVPAPVVTPVRSSAQSATRDEDTN